MGTAWRVRIDMEKLRSRLSNVVALPQVEAWLRSEGFEKYGDYWVAPSNAALGLLSIDEILHAAELREAVISEVEAAEPIKADHAWQPSTRVRTPKAPKNGLLAVPAALVGRHRDVARACRAIAGRAVKVGAWEGAIPDGEWMSLEEIPGLFILEGPALTLESAPLLLYTLLDALREAARGANRIDWYRRQRDLTLGGIDQFWFTLICFADWSLIDCELTESDRPGVFYRMAKAMVRYWPEFCSRADRFSARGDEPAPFQYWGIRAIALFQGLGVPADDIHETLMLTPDEAGARMHVWLRKLGSAAPDLL